MLQTTNPVRADDAGREADIITMRETIGWLQGLVVRHLPVMLLTFAVCVALGGTYLITAPRLYSSTAELIIDSRKSQALQQQNPLGTELPLDSATVESQVEILKSESIALAVINDLRLFDVPEFTSPSGIDAVLDGISGLFSEPQQLSERALTRWALGRFRQQLFIKRRGLSYIIEISFMSQSPERAARIANAVADAYIVDSLESKYQSSRRAASWLQDRMKELRAQASNAERAVVEYRAKNNIVDTGGRLLTEQQLAEINSSLTIARTQRAEAQARLERISSILQNENRAPGDIVNDLATVTDSLRNEVITRLRQQYLDLAARQSDWTNRYGPQHLAVVNLTNQMREIRRSIADELRRIAETYKSDFEIAKAREESSEKALKDTISQSNDTSQAQIVLRELESSAQSARALADNFLQLYMVSVQQQSFPMTEARVITQGSAPGSPATPKTMLVVLATIGAGIGLAFAIAFLRDILDRVFRTDTQVESILGVNCLALVPRIGGSPGKRRKPAGKLFKSLRRAEPADKNPVERVVSYRTELQNYVVHSPFARYTEAVRNVKMAWDLNALDSGVGNVVGLTSCLPNEGKTTLTLSLAQLTAQSGVRTLLVDGDLRNPSLSARIAPKAGKGLIDVITGKERLEDVIWHDPVTKLDFLPCVVSSRLARSSDLLSSTEMEKFFAELKKSYDRIILDLSPLAPVVDVRGTSKLVDSYVLVIDWGRTKIDVVVRALSEVPMINRKMLGVVLNKADLKVISRYDLYRGNYYHNEYYRRYGYVD